MIALMSASLNVVSMAAVFCASFSRRAIVWRRRVIGTRSSRTASLGAAGARISRAGTGILAGPPPAAASRPAGAGRAGAALASSFKICPRRPEPTRSAGPRPFSCMILRAAGVGGITPSPLAGGPAGAAAALGRAASGAGVVGCGAGASAAAPACAPAAAASMAPNTAPTATVLPCGTLMSLSTPAEGAGTSTVTLSVSSSTRGSSMATASPGRLNHCPTVASVTDSPSAGTLISIAILRSSSPQGFGNQGLLLGGVPAGEAGGGRRRGGPAGVNGPFRRQCKVLQDPFEVRLHEAPGAHVLWFLLCPNHLASCKARELADQRPGREWIVLLDAQQIDVIPAGRFACLVKIVVN